MASYVLFIVRYNFRIGGIEKDETLLKKTEEDDKLITKDRRIICPVCGRGTQYRGRPDTKAKNWPIWCKHCRKESIVNI